MTEDNNRVMPDSCIPHTDNDHENDAAADPEEACVEACPTTHTDDLQQEGDAPGSSDTTASRQAHRETRPAAAEEESQQEQTQTDSSTQRHVEVLQGVSQQRNPTQESPTVYDASTLTPILCAHNHHVTSYLSTTRAILFVWLCQQVTVRCMCRTEIIPFPRGQ